MTPEHVIEGAAMMKQAGIRLLASFIFGLGSKASSKEHIIETTPILNITQPEEIAPMALTIQPGSTMEQEVKTGKFIQATPLQILEEEKYLLENLNINSYYWGDHGNNIASMRGWLPQHQQDFKQHIVNQITANPVTEQEILRTYAW